MLAPPAWRYAGILVAILGAVSGQETFVEQLHLDALPHYHILAHFNFTSHVPVSTSASNLDSHSYDIFPRAIGDILTAFQVEELHFELGRGHWDTSVWGYAPVESVGTGAELWSYLTPRPFSPRPLEAEGDEEEYITLEEERYREINRTAELQERWAGLTNAMAGLFCASLNFMDSSTTSTPADSFSPQGLVSESARLMRSALAHESLCTENLTPFIKQLPCRDQAGIASLLNPHAILSAKFHAITVDVRRGCLSHLEDDGTCSAPSWELRQSITAVMRSGEDWTVDGLFQGPSPQASCPKASSSAIVVGGRAGPPKIIPLPASLPTEGEGAISEISTIPAYLAQIQPEAPDSTILINRRLAGSGQEGGKFLIALSNPHPHKSVSVTYLDVIPWYLRIYLSTLSIRVNGREEGVEEGSGALRRLRYLTARDRERPSTIELTLELPPASLLTLSFDVDRAMLKYSEHPPDANRGFDLPPAVLTLRGKGSTDPSTSSNSTWRVYTTPLLVSLPTPDFSMPYNVITLTCTAVALFFGSMFNLLTRQLVPVDVA